MKEPSIILDPFKSNHAATILKEKGLDACLGYVVDVANTQLSARLHIEKIRVAALEEEIAALKATAQVYKTPEILSLVEKLVRSWSSFRDEDLLEVLGKRRMQARKNLEDAISQALSTSATLGRKTVEDLLAFAESRICTHEETHRGGLIWEICNSCGRKWADDEGGKPKFKWPDAIKNARTLLGTSVDTSAEVPDSELTTLTKAIKDLTSKVEHFEDRYVPSAEFLNRWRDPVLKLAEAWNSSISESAVETLKNLETTIAATTSARIERKLKSDLSTSSKVHNNMLLGKVAKISMNQCAHVHGTEAIQRWLYIKDFKMPSPDDSETMVARDQIIHESVKASTGFTHKNAQRQTWDEAIKYVAMKFDRFLQGIPQ